MNFVDDSFMSVLQNPQDSSFAVIKEFLFHLALCHSIIIDAASGAYTASSPDELALVNAAKFFGCTFMSRDEENNM